MSNLLLTPNTPFTSGNWSFNAGTATHSEAFAAGLDGTTTAWLITDTDGGNISQIGQSVTLPANTLPYCFFYFVKKNSATKIPALIIRLGVDPFSPTSVYGVQVDTATGGVTPVTVGGWSAPTNTGSTDFGTFWLVWLTVANTSNVNWTPCVAPAFNGSLNGGGDASLGGGAVFWGGGLFQASAPVLTPVADFSGTPTSGVTTLAVAFTDLSTNTPTTWAWDFGDGGTSTSQNPTHNYSAVGVYTVAMTATNAAGSNQKTRTSYITALIPVPVASFTYTPATGTPPLSVTFTDASTHSPTSWAWSFGDGSTSTSQNPTHTYTAAGSYTVALTATNATGSGSATVTAAVEVISATMPLQSTANILGAQSIASPSSTSFVVSCADSRRLVRYAKSAGVWNQTGGSADIGSEPGKIIAFNSKLWTVTADGYLRRFTAAATPVQDLAVNVYADTNRWLVAGGVSPYAIVAPGRAGGLVSLSMSGAIIARAEGVLSRIVCALGITDAITANLLYVYCFDGAGNGAIVTVASDGSLDSGGAFAATNCHGVLDGFATADNHIVLAVAQDSRVVVFDATDLTAPVYDAAASETYTGVLNGVVIGDDTLRRPLTDDEQSSIGLPVWLPSTAGIAVTSSILAIAHGRNARIQVT